MNGDANQPHGDALKRASARLRALLGARGVIEDPAAIKPMTEAWRDSWLSEPGLVIQPGSTEEVREAVAICAEEGVPVVTQGGNTGLTGGGLARAGFSEVLLSTRRLNRIRALDLDNDTLTAEAGCVLDTVKQAALAAGRLFPLSLGAEGSCTVGGNIATNAGGINALRYGPMRDLVAGVEVVTADGRVWDGLRELRKDNAGYDLKHLFIGSEGTLGICVGLASAQAGLAWFRRLRGAFGDGLAACELMERFCVESAVAHVPGIQDPLGQAHAWYVLCEIASPEQRDDLADALGETFGEALEAGEVEDGVLAASLDQSRALWRLREAIPEAQRMEGVSFKHDISVPVSRVAEFIETANAALAETFPGIRSFAFGHLGDGNIHFNPIQAKGDPAEGWRGRLPAVNRIAHDVAVRLGGSITAEHGIGLLRREELAVYRSGVELDLMRAVKQALDPHNILNPGKVLG